MYYLCKSTRLLLKFKITNETLKTLLMQGPSLIRLPSLSEAKIENCALKLMKGGSFTYLVKNMHRPLQIVVVLQ